MYVSPSLKTQGLGGIAEDIKFKAYLGYRALWPKERSLGRWMGSLKEDIETRAPFFI